MDIIKPNFGGGRPLTNTKPGTGPSVQVAAVAIMIKGLAADLHTSRNTIKRTSVPFDAGFDLIPGHADPEMTQLDCGVMFKINTFINICIPVGTYGYICERSSTIDKLQGARVRNAIIDPGFIGEILITVLAPLDAWEKVLSAIKQAQKDQIALAQMIFIPFYMPVFATWDDRMVPPGRGTKGFGHTDLMK